MKIEDLPRVNLCALPTPLMEMPSLSTELGGPQILIKRDDLIGLALGGQKSRMFEFSLADARDKGADVVINGGFADGTTSPQLTAAANKLGMETISLSCGREGPVQGNLLVLHLLGAEVRKADVGLEDKGKVAEQLEILADELRRQGRKPYIFSMKTPLAMAGYACAIPEIMEQLRQKGLTAQYLFMGSSGACFQAGITLGVRYYQAPFKVVGVMHSHLTGEGLFSTVTGMVSEFFPFFDLDPALSAGEVTVDDAYIGEGYGTLTETSKEAARLVARTEGIILDPFYTARAMASLIDRIRRGEIGKDETVVFYHSGNMPALFSHSEELLS